MDTSIRYTFHKQERIHKDKEFQTIFKFGKKYFCNDLLIYVYPTVGILTCRLGFVISRKTEKSAVIRNRFKRRIREIFRLNKHKIKPGTDILVIATKGSVKDDYHHLEQNFIECIKKAGVFLD